MATSLPEFVSKLVLDLVLSAVKKTALGAIEDYFKRKRIEQQVESAVLLVVEPLLPFMKTEGLNEQRQRLLMETCVSEMQGVVDAPASLFRAGLEGQTLFDQLYAKRPYPEVLRHEDLQHVYEMIGPRIATLLCELTTAVDQWQVEKWREDYRRLEDIARKVRDIFDKIDASSKEQRQATDDSLHRLRRTLAQKLHLKMDLKGLRGDRLLDCNITSMFIHPGLTIERSRPIKKERPQLDTEADSAKHFLARGRRAVLVGPPGAGKSTWMKWLQSQALSEQWFGVALRIELRSFAKANPGSYAQLLRSEAGPHLAEELVQDRIRQWIDAGSAAFLLDGFDELPTERRDSVLEWIQLLVQVAPACPVIVTSRPLTTAHLEYLADGWQHWSVNDFDEDRLIRYVRAWYQYAPLLHETERTVDAQQLALKWRQDSTLLPLTGNPLLLSTLLLVNYLDGRLPNGRAKLYERYVDGMLGGWDEQRKVEADAFKLPAGQKRRLLRLRIRALRNFWWPKRSLTGTNGQQVENISTG